MSFRTVVIFFALLSIFYTDSHDFDEEAQLNNKIKSPPTDSVISACPRENYSFLKRVNGNKSAESVFAKVGEEVSFECNPDGEEFIAQYRRHPTQFIVYPLSTRKCLPNGTWSGVPPLCAWAPENVSAKERKYTEVFPRGEYCYNNPICVEARETWVPVGQLYKKGSQTSDCSQVENMDVFENLYTFSQHIHLSFMTFNLNFNHEAGYYVEVRVSPQDVISNLSDPSTHLLNDSSKLWLKEMINLAYKSAVTSIAAYTDRVVVRFLQSRQNTRSDWVTQPQFFAIPRLNSTNLEVFDSDESMYCPERPTQFPNAKVVNETRDRSSFIIYCNDEFSVKDPVTKEHLAWKNVTCLGKLEWSPYPFPVCTPDEKESIDREANANLRRPLTEERIFKTELLNFKLQCDSRVSLELSIRLFEEFTSNNAKETISWTANEYNTRVRELLKASSEFYETRNGEKNTDLQNSEESEDRKNSPAGDSYSSRPLTKEPKAEIEQSPGADANTTSNSAPCYRDQKSDLNNTDASYELDAIILTFTLLNSAMMLYLIYELKRRRNQENVAPNQVRYDPLITTGHQNSN